MHFQMCWCNLRWLTAGRSAGVLVYQQMIDTILSAIRHERYNFLKHSLVVLSKFAIGTFVSGV